MSCNIEVCLAPGLGSQYGTLVDRSLAKIDLLIFLYRVPKCAGGETLFLQVIIAFRKEVHHQNTTTGLRFPMARGKQVVLLQLLC
jgi:hypothetical protein